MDVKREQTKEDIRSIEGFADRIEKKNENDQSKALQFITINALLNYRRW